MFTKVISRCLQRLKADVYKGYKQMVNSPLARKENYKFGNFREVCEVLRK